MKPTIDKTKPKRRKGKKKQRDMVWELIKDFDCDAVIMERGFGNGVCVMPHNTKTQETVCGMNYITSFEDVMEQRRKYGFKIGTADKNLQKRIGKYFKEVT